MIRNYSNKKIYKNLKAVKILSIIALILAVLTVIVYICQEYINHLNSGIDENQILFYIFTLGIPINIFVATVKAKEQKSVGKFLGETKLNNDFSNLLALIILSFIPYILLIFYCLLFICFHSPNPANLSYVCGYMLPAHFFVHIADVFLIHNCILIKQEWKDNPPDFVKEQNAIKTQIKQKQTLNKNKAQYNNYIDKCGIKFFIKYCGQIKRLPLRDVAISENYTPTEKEERLVAAKKLIELGLEEFTLKEILNTYSDILDKDDIVQAEFLLEEIQETNTVIK